MKHLRIPSKSESFLTDAHRPESLSGTPVFIYAPVAVHDKRGLAKREFPCFQRGLAKCEFLCFQERLAKREFPLLSGEAKRERER